MNGRYTTKHGIFHHLVAEGSAYEVGQVLGEMFKQDTRAMGDYAQARVNWDATPFKDGAHAKTFYEAMCPGITEEIQGFADSMRASLEQVLYRLYTANTGPAHCSHLVALPAITADSHVYVARSYEWKPDEDQELCLCTLRVRGKAAHIGFVAGLFGRYDGMNAHGLSVTTCGGTSMHWQRWEGLNFSLLMRAMLDRCKTVDEALACVQDKPAFFYANVVIADRDGHAALLEMAGDQRAIKTIDPYSDDKYLIATNHYTLAGMTVCNMKDGVMRHSIPRYTAMQRMFIQHAPRVGKDALRTLLAREFPEGCFCPYYQFNLGTLWSEIFDLTDGTVEICFGAPNRNEWRHFNTAGQAGVTVYVAEFPEKQI